MSNEQQPSVDYSKAREWLADEGYYRADLETPEALRRTAQEVLAEGERRVSLARDVLVLLDQAEAECARLATQVPPASDASTVQPANKKIFRKVVERYIWHLEKMVRLECGHTTHERGRWVGGELVLNQTARCWDCETGLPDRPAPISKQIGVTAGPDHNDNEV